MQKDVKLDCNTKTLLNTIYMLESCLSVKGYYDQEKELSVRNHLIEIQQTNPEAWKLYIDHFKKQRERYHLDQIWENSSTIHLISSKYEYTPSIKQLELKYPGITKMMKRGDIIEDISVSGYRSQGVFFFDGKKVIDQDTSWDDYGSVPIDFKLITEFLPGNWDHSNLKINAKYVKTSSSLDESKFYWHSESVPCTVDLELSGLRAEVKNNLTTYDSRQCVILEYNKINYLIYICDDCLKECLDDNEKFVYVFNNPYGDTGSKITILGKEVKIDYVLETDPY